MAFHVFGRHQLLGINVEIVEIWCKDELIHRIVDDLCGIKILFCDIVIESPVVFEDTITSLFSVRIHVFGIIRVTQFQGDGDLA